MWTIINPLLLALLTVPAGANLGFDADCAFNVWSIPSEPGFYGWECKGTCDSNYSCTERHQLIQGVHYYNCKCLLGGEPPMPDSTLCTSVMTYDTNTGLFDVYCVAQACSEGCDEHPITDSPLPPCHCDN